MNSLTPSFSPDCLASLWDELDRQSFPEGALYVVATPIGNVGDISLRAIRVLSLADAIACEDTRNTGQLIARLGLSKPLFSAHQHNERETAQKIVERLHAGARIALVSDAGTPAVSDPGARIVDAVIEAGLKVIPVAGPTAAIAALSVSGLLSEQFYFVGFMPAKSSQREQLLSRLVSSTANLVFYEAPHRILEAAQSLLTVLGPERRIVIAREISKLFEQVHRCRLAEATDWLSAEANHQRGEFVLVVEGQKATNDQPLSDARHVLQTLLEELPVSQAATLAAKITGMKKNALYQLALELRPQDLAD
jgi:16S rRNA (cytidine1402-2'-O)-methyltransferase